MDFKKLETIFLVAFLGLNIFLFSIFIQNKKVDSQLNNGEERDAIELRLSKDHITYEGELSKEKSKGYFLSGEDTLYEQVNDFNLYSQVNGVSDNRQEQVVMNEYLITEKDADKEVKKWLQDADFFIYPNEYHYQSILSNFGKENPRLIATQYYEDLPFNDDSGKLIMKLRNTTQGSFKVESLLYSHLKNIVNLREKQELISQREAISTLYYNSKIPQEAKINWCYLAYGKILKVREKNVYVPIWFVSITPKDEKTRIEQINAVNNTIVTNNSIPTVEK